MKLWNICFRSTDKRKHRSKSRTRKTSASSDDEQKRQQHTTAPALNYNINYEQGSQTLVLTIIKCSNLKKADLMGGKPDPMVNIFLRPGNLKAVKTKVVKNEQNPTFNETFRFQVFIKFNKSFCSILAISDPTSRCCPENSDHASCRLGQIF